MESKKINALLTAIDKGSLTAAAAELGYTQSGLTHMMDTLETELGLNLLVRSKGGVRLSPAGLLLQSEMKDFVASSERLEQKAEQLRQVNYSTLRLGAYSSIAHHWLPEMLLSFRESCPDTQVTVSAGGIDALYTAVKEDELDCAILSYQPRLCQGLKWIPLWKDELLAVLPEGYYPQSDSFPSKLFDGTDFLMPSLGFELDIMPIFDSPGEKRIQPVINSTNMDDSSIVSMVEHSLGVSVLSRLVMQGMHYQVQTLPLSPPAYRSLGIVVTKRLMGEKTICRLITCAKDLMNRKYRQE